MHENDSDDIEKIISDLYSDVSQEQPSSALDEKVLSEARQELQQNASDNIKSFTKKGGGPFSGSWTVPVSLAAVIILSVTVVVTIEKERPYQLTSTPDEMVITQSDSKSDAALAGKPLLKGIAIEEAVERKAVKSKSEETLAEETIKEQEVLALMQQVEPERRQLANKPVPASEGKAEAPVRQQDPVSAEDKLDKAVRENIGSAGAGAAGSSAAEVEIASAPPVLTKQVIRTEKKADSLADSPAASEERAAEAEADKMRTFATMTKPKPVERADVSRLSALAKRTDSGDVDEPVMEQAKPQAIQPVKPEAVAASPAAKLVAPAESFNAPANANAVEESASQTNCSALSVTDCLNSVECMLESGEAGRDYQCRVAKNQCESGFSQAIDTRDTCESRPGCKYIAANCFCPPGVECVCGGGAPAVCVPE
jgi:hypothetical protein